MNTFEFQELLKKHNACHNAKLWAQDKTWQEVFDDCQRGDWLLWLYKKVNPNNLRELTLIKGHCAATVSHLMSDQRSIVAVKAAIAFGNGEIEIEQLKVAASYAANAADAYAADAFAVANAANADDFAANAAAYAAFTAANAAYADAAAYAADAAAYAAFANADDFAADAARTKNQLETANICRKYLPIEIWDIN